MAPKTTPTIRKGDFSWEQLVFQWKSEKKPAVIIAGTQHFRVNTPSDLEDEVSFTPFGGIDGNYGSITRVPGA